MSFTALFPQPKQITELGGSSIELAHRPIEMTIGNDHPLIQAGRELFRTDGQTNSAGYHIDAAIKSDDPAWPTGVNREEAYTLELRPEGGRLIAPTPRGFFLGCQTLRQLARESTDALPAVRIVDWPDLRYRGLYVESKWGPDLMTLTDWQYLIDDLARRKFNSLCIGVYGCWVIQYGGQWTEFLMLPFPDRPELTTPKTLHYYSPKAAAWQTLDYLPKMVTDDLFGEIVAYGMKQNVFVRPHFNSPGHNTILPRVYPEVSARDENGQPIGYGFCLSNPRTYELIFDLYDSVIERYLRPHGCDWFHIGLDEVEAYAGIDPRDPSRPVEPWCRCPDCRDKSHALQLQQYAVRVCSHLKEQGINHITMWNDALSKLDALNHDFVQMLDAASLRDNVIVQWWRYNDPVLIPDPNLGLRSWSTPMAGYWSNLFTHSYTSNIYAMVLHGARHGAEGADAYCIYDPAFDRNYACLAEFSWNQPATEDLYQFKHRYTQNVLGTRLDQHLAAEAFDKYDQAFDSMPWTGTTLSSLLYYWHSYPAARARGEYPRDMLIDLQSSHMRLRQGLASAATHARTARDLFAQANAQNANPLLDEYRAECEKLVGVWDAFAIATDAITRYETDRAVASVGAAIAKTTAERIRAADQRLVSVMADLEQVKQPYLLPQILRDMSVLHGYFERLADALTEAAQTSERDPMIPLPSFHEISPSQSILDTIVSSAPSVLA